LTHILQNTQEQTAGKYVQIEPSPSIQ